MLQIITFFLLGLGVVSVFIGYSLTGFIYALLLTSILITLVGVIKGKPNGRLVDKQS